MKLWTECIPHTCRLHCALSSTVCKSQINPFTMWSVDWRAWMLLCVWRLWRFLHAPHAQDLLSSLLQRARERSSQDEGSRWVKWPLRGSYKRQRHTAEGTGTETLRGEDVRKRSLLDFTPRKTEILACVHWTCPLRAWSIYHSVSNTFSLATLLARLSSIFRKHWKECLGQVRTLSLSLFLLQNPKRSICQVQ